MSGTKSVEWFVAMVDMGHDPVLDHGGDLDDCVYALDFHNGPGCRVCGWDACWHCTGISSIPRCAGPGGYEAREIL